MAPQANGRRLDSNLFRPLALGRNLNLQHRVVLAPMTRLRADNNHVLLPCATEYYSQRSRTPGSLLITEAVLITERGGYYRNKPGIWTPDQIAAWRSVTKAVHMNGSHIFCQLLTLGRAIDPATSETGSMGLISSSATPIEEGGEVPRALSVREIHAFTDSFAQAALNAIEAGFDGVEIHAANGYLVDQFTQEICNKRTDEYGGSVANRSRFALEVVRKVCDAIGPHRTAIRLSPFGTQYGIKSTDPQLQFTHLITELRDFHLAYLHLVESMNTEAFQDLDFAVKTWGWTRPIIFAGGYDAESALQKAERYSNHDLCIAFARYFISNPDLAFRLRHGIKLAAWNPAHFVNAESEEGYTDYAFSAEFLKPHL